MPSSLKRHNRVYILSSKHTFRTMTARVVAQLFYKTPYCVVTVEPSLTGGHIVNTNTLFFVPAKRPYIFFKKTPLINSAKGHILKSQPV